MAAEPAQLVELLGRLDPLGDDLELEGLRQVHDGPHDGVVMRASCTLKETEAVMESFPGPAIARAGNGVCYGYFEHAQAAAEWMAGAAGANAKVVVEFAPDRVRGEMELWPHVGPDFEIMKRVKNLFDPRNLLNRGRLYRRI